MQEVDIFAKSRELALLMKSEPKSIDRELLHAGSQIIAIFRDPNFGDQIAGRKTMEIDLLKFAIEDIAMGAMSLTHNQVGLNFRERKIQTFLTPLGSSPGGNVVMSLTLKNRAAFKKFRNNEAAELEQSDIEAALYYLTFILSEVINHER